MKIYTKTGDKGLTGLIGGARVPKYHVRIESYGTVDELNAFIGLIYGQNISAGSKEILKAIQNDLFVIGASLATDPVKGSKRTPVLDEEHIRLLEQEIDRMTASLPELRHFILPGGNDPVSFCHIARCICRRAERSIVHLNENEEVEERILVYMNRLSDYLFVLARQFAADSGIEENIWISSR